MKMKEDGESARLSAAHAHVYGDVGGHETSLAASISEVKLP